jgi:hypothetical protein
MNLNDYRKFLENYAINDSVAFLLIDRRSNQPPRQYHALIRHARNSSFHNRLWAANRNGADVYVSMNPLLPGATGRTKADVAVVRHLYLDFDIDGDARLDRLLADSSVPTPHMILHTSQGKWQVIWNVTGFTAEQAEGTHRRLVSEFGADPAAVDVSRVLRVPSFFNNKYSPPFCVSLVRHEGQTLSPTNFDRFPPQAEAEVRRAGARTPSTRSPLDGISQSERDWAWTLEQLKRGRSPQSIVQDLADRRHDKPSPLYYARHTVQRAELELQSRTNISTANGRRQPRVR